MADDWKLTVSGLDDVNRELRELPPSCAAAR